MAFSSRSPFSTSACGVEVQDEVEVPVVVHVLDAKRAVGPVIGGPEGLAWSK